MEGLLTALRNLSKVQIGILVIVVIAFFGLTYGSYVFTSSSGDESLEENQRLIPARLGNLANQVSINGSIVFSNKETMTFGSGGTVAEILVDEGDEIEEGQPLVSLDVESIATLQQAVAEAKIALQDAENVLKEATDPALDVAEAKTAVSTAKLSLKDAQEALTPSAQAVAEAEAAVSDAELALQVAQDELDDLVIPPAKAVADAESVIAEAKIALKDAEEAVGEELLDAISEVNAISKELESANNDLELAPNENAIRQARSTLVDADDAYQSAFQKWLGIDLTDEELLLTPDELFIRWELDLETVYDRSYDLFPDDVIRDNPETRWNELDIYGWRNLYPDFRLVIPVCRESDSLGRNDMCISREIADSWEAFDDARNDLDTLLNQSEKSASDAESRIIRLEDDLDEAQKVLDRLSEDGLQTDLLKKQLAAAQVSLSDAEETLEELLTPDEVDLKNKQKQVALALANLHQAQDDLAELLEPDAVELESRNNEVAVAEAVLLDAENTLAELVANRDLQIELAEAQVSSAQAMLNGASERYEKSTLKAPFDGYVATIQVEEGEEVGATTAILEVINPSIVKVEGVVDEIDVLSVQLGAVASVTMDALPNQVLDGTVTNVSSAATAQQGVVTFDVGIVVTVPEELRLQEGLSAVASVMLGEESGLLIPNQAIQGTFTQPQALIRENGRFELVPISLGNSDGFWTVVQGGLTEGDEVVMEVEDVAAQHVGFRGFGGGGRSGGGGGGR